MVYGLGRKHPIGLYSPFSLIQITAEEPTSSRPPTLKEATSMTISCDEAAKQCIALFLSEVLYLTLRHPMADEPLFDFIARACNALWSEQDSVANFHLIFLIGFAAQLGFAINEEEQPQLVRLPHSRSERQEQLRMLCAYFNEHVDSWTEPRSLDILMEVFD